MSAGGRPCSVCDDPRRPAIEAELASSVRKSYPQLADVFRPISSQALRRHHLTHMGAGAVAPPTPATPVGGEPPDPAAPASDLLKLGRQLQAWTVALLEEAAEDGDFRDVANALRVGLQTHERLMKAFAARPPEFDPLRDSTICALRDLVAGALADEPTARAKVMAAFQKAAGAEGAPA